MDNEADYVRICFNLLDRFGSNESCCTSSKRSLDLTFENLFKQQESDYCKRLRYTSHNALPGTSLLNAIRIRVYAGGESGNMSGPFVVAMSNTSLQKKGIVTVDYKYKKVNC
jgi:hypothetical protein